MKTSLLTIFLLLSQTAFASLYECIDAESEPTPVTSSSTVDFMPSKADFFPKAFSPEGHNKNRKPFLIYYAVDSIEPFMNYTVKYEVASLKKACESSEHVNFVAFLNSLYTESNEFVYCKNKEFKTVKLSSYPSLDASLKKKNAFIKSGDHTTSKMGPMNFLVRYQQKINEAFGKYPLAHPDFLYDLINLAITETDLFPSNFYMPFLNLKSHGSTDNVLSGLQSCQEKAKIKSQQESISKVLTAQELEFINHFDFHSDLNLMNTILEKIGLGSSMGVGGDSNLGKDHLGKDHLGKDHLGAGSRHSLGKDHLSASVAGLGANNGLGAEWSFGLYHSGLTAILSQLFNEDNKKQIGFVMLESCDTNRDIGFHHAVLDNVLGIYSAKHSLWYRNLNWWSILNEAGGSTLKLVELLQTHTEKIENIIVK